jgi:hypothetical protein
MQSFVARTLSDYDKDKLKDKKEGNTQNQISVCLEI